MKRIVLVVCVCGLISGIHAQDLPLPATNPAMSMPAAQKVAPRIDDAAVDEHAVNQKLAAKNALLKRENAALSQQVVSLKASLDAFTSRGGSRVRAYCEDSPRATNGLSRNTAGVQADCTAAGYLCEPVSGLCRTTCQTTAMCAVGWVCDTEAQHCLPPGG